MAAPELRVTIRIMAPIGKRKLKTAMWVALGCALLLAALFVGSRISGKLYPLAHLAFEDIAQGTSDKTTLRFGTALQPPLEQTSAAETIDPHRSQRA